MGASRYQPVRPLKWDDEIKCWRVTLTRGAEALIDHCDYKLISGINWHLYAHNGDNRGYAKSRKLGLMHHVIMGEIPSGFVADHINRNRLDNRRSNLRLITPKENAANKSTRAGRKYKGVSIRPSGRWMASVGEKYIGVYDTEIQAAMAYNNAAREMYGNCAALNVIHEENCNENSDSFYFADPSDAGISDELSGQGTLGEVEERGHQCVYGLWSGIEKHQCCVVGCDLTTSFVRLSDSTGREGFKHKPGQYPTPNLP